MSLYDMADEARLDRERIERENRNTNNIAKMAAAATGKYEQQISALTVERDALKDQMQRCKNSVCEVSVLFPNVAAYIRQQEAKVARLREATKAMLTAFCEHTCHHDMNYGGVKHHDPECEKYRAALDMCSPMCESQEEEKS